MKRACSRCRKEHRACEGGLPCGRCVALGHNDDDMLEQRKKQEGRCSRQAQSHSITTPTKQKTELGSREQACPQFRRPHRCSTPSSSSSSPQPPQGSAMALKGKPLRQGNPGHLSPLFSSFPLSAGRPTKRKRSPKKEKHTKSAKASLEATPTASAPRTDTAGSTSSGSPCCAENAPAAQLGDVLASLVAQVRQLSNMVSCIQEEQDLMGMQVRSLQDARFRTRGLHLPGAVTSAGASIRNSISPGVRIAAAPTSSLPKPGPEERIILTFHGAPRHNSMSPQGI